ncbi:MAG: molybdopterin-dependent oxidoreductase [Vicinamibacterales bacterium]
MSRERELTRREALSRGTAGLAALAALGIPAAAWAMQAGEELVAFSDYTDDFRIEASPRNPRVRCYDLRRLTSWQTPADEFYTFHQTETVHADPAAFRLTVSGFVERPRVLTLDEIVARPDRRDEAVTLECSGNSTRPQRMSGLLSNGVWTGVSLRSLLEECGLRPDAREVVFLGLDMEREKKWQARNQEYDIPHGRSVYVQDALHPDAMLAFALNGAPLPPEQGFPLRLILPGWYGMTQVKWLTRIHVLDRRYEGQHQSRNYLSLRAVETADGPIWLDTSISRNNLKSAVARVTRRRVGSGSTFAVSGAAWGGQEPIGRVEVQVDGGTWQPATLGERQSRYAWRLWSTDIGPLPAGAHTVASRAFDVKGARQPTAEERAAALASGREDNAIWTRSFVVHDGV